MNKSAFERQLQDLHEPAPDPAARLRARQMAVAELERHRALPPRATFMRRTRLMRAAAAACVPLLGVAIVAHLAADPGRPQAIGEEIQVGEPEPPAAVLPAPPAVPSGRPGASPPTVPTVRPAPAARAAVAPVGPDAGDDAVAVAGGDARAGAGAGVGVGGAGVGGAGVGGAGVGGADVGVGSGTGGRGQLAATPVASPESPIGQQFIEQTIASLRQLEPQSGTRPLTMVDGRDGTGTTSLLPAPLSAAAADGMAGILPASVGTQPQRVRYFSWGPPAPVVSRSDQFGSFETGGVKQVADEPVSTFSLDVDTTSYSFTRRLLRDGRLPPADAVRVEEMINYFDYAWPASRAPETPFRTSVAVSDSPWSQGRKLVHIGIGGYSLPQRDRPEANVVLLVDVSGSMDEPDKLPLVRRAMRLLLDALQPTDTVSIATYAGSAGEALGPTPVSERASIEAAIDALQAGGATAGAQGLQLAYELARRDFRQDGVNRILLATDGDFNLGSSDPDTLTRLVQRERASGVYLSVLGFGQGNYRDDIAQALAQNGNGVAAYIDSIEEARKVLVREATSSLFPIAHDVKLQVEFNPAVVAEYRLVGHETRALSRGDFGDDRVDAGEVGAGRKVTAIYEITLAGTHADSREPLRYGREVAPAPAARRTDELGFVKIRYKLPGEQDSRLLEQPIPAGAGVPRTLQQDVAFSTAVAGFGQLLRGGPALGDFDFGAVMQLARESLGEDPHGERRQFLDLVGAAQEAARPSRQ